MSFFCCLLREQSVIGKQWPIQVPVASREKNFKKGAKDNPAAAYALAERIGGCWR